MNRREFLKMSGLTIGGVFIPPFEIEWPAGVRVRFDVNQDVFALTIDDGWSADTILEFVQFCHDHNLKATWFAVGIGLERVRDEPQIMEIMAEDNWTVGYHTMHHHSVDEQALYDRQDWINDYSQWLEIANETFKEYPWVVMPYARAAGGLFSYAFMEMCGVMGLTAYAWSQDSHSLVRGGNIVRGDVVLTHFRKSDWPWFEQVAAHDLEAVDILLMESLEEAEDNEKVGQTVLPICKRDDGNPPCLYKVNQRG